jgi:teichuronic acid exporter
MKLFKKYNQSEFLRNIIIVMTGTAASQIIALAFTPILSRFYSPEDFGYFGTFMAIYTILSAFATGKYERAILLIDDKLKIKTVSTLVLLISIFSSLSIFILLIIIKVLNLNLIYIDNSLVNWLFLLPVFILTSAINIVFVSFLNFNKDFKELSRTRVVKTLVTVIFSLGAIYFMKSFGGLILGELLGLLISTIYLFPKLHSLFSFSNAVRSSLVPLAKRYRNFPLFTIPTDFMNQLSYQVPVFALNLFFGPGITGQYSLTKRALDAPMTLLSSSILEVFRQKSAELYFSVGDSRPLFLKTAKSLLFLAIVPFAIILIWGVDIFTFIFGREWARAGEFASIFSMFYFFRFVSSPLTYIFFIAEKQKAAFIINLYLLISTIIIFALPKYFELPINNLMWIFTFNNIFIYIINFVLSYKYSLRK